MNDLKRKARGPTGKPTLRSTSLRLPRDVMEYFDQNFPYGKQAKIREVLIGWVRSKKAKEELDTVKEAATLGAVDGNP